MLRIMAHDFDNCDNAGGLVSHSMDDKRALGIMARTVKKVGDHYSVGLLWKDDNPSLPNSRSLAEKIIVSLKCRLGKNPSLLEKYKEKMIEYIQNYAESVPIEQPSQVGRVYYVPHHCTSGVSKFKARAIGAGGLGFESRAGQIGTVSPTARHRCDVSSELCSPGAKLRRWAPQLVTRFGVIRQV